MSGSIRHARQTCVVCCLIVLASLSSVFIGAQNSPSPRKVIYKVAPKYPRELKQNDIGGIVRLSISIAPDGSVKKVSPIGGNPILVDATVIAVKQWKYAPADHLTNTEVQVDFIPHDH